MNMLFLMNKTKDQIPWVSSHDLYWENKMYKRKRSIGKWKSALKNKYVQIDYFNWLLKWNSRILKSKQLFSGFLQFKSYFARGQRFTPAPRSIYQYSNMAPRLSGQTAILVLFSLYRSPAWESRDKRNLNIITILTRKPRSHHRILIYIERGPSIGTKVKYLANWRQKST